MERKDFLKWGGLTALVPLKRAASDNTLKENLLEASGGLKPLKNAEQEIYILPNFHPASCGWLADFSKERNYCANNYLDHLDRVESDSKYKFVLSEVNNMIAIKNFQPKRFRKLKKYVHEGRIEAANAFFLEPTINLSGGEALVKQGVEGIRWQQEVLGITPRFLWMIDVIGMHKQMAQITAGLGLDGLFYCRNNPTQSTMQWLESPDGSSTLGTASGHYSDWNPVFRTDQPLDKQALSELQQQVQTRLRDASGDRELTPDDTPYLVLGGSGDYSLAPDYKGYPSELIHQWKEHYPEQSLYFSVPGEYYDRTWPFIKGHKVPLPVVKGGWPYSSYRAFWIQSKVKKKFRKAEHLLQATEALATIKSLSDEESNYPTQKFYHAWLQLLLNMDRNTLWGGAGGMVFESKRSWDVQDRFDWIDTQMNDLIGTDKDREADHITLFNSCNWNRKEPLTLDLPLGKSLKDVACQRLSNGKLLCLPEVPSMGERTFEIQDKKAQPKEISFTGEIETPYYIVEINADTGHLTSIKMKSSGKELLGGPANRIIPERPTVKKRHLFSDEMVPRDQRKEVPVKSSQKPKIKVYKGEAATIVMIRSTFLNNQPMERILRFYHDHPRIDFETTVHDIPDKTVVSAEFSISSEAGRIRRGIPYGFAEGAWPDYDPSIPGTVAGITPAIRWSDYLLDNGLRVAILDRGLTGREYDGRSALLLFMAATDNYRGFKNPWLSGKGKHHFEYSLFVSEYGADEAAIQKEAYAYNAPVIQQNKRINDEQSFLETSENVIVQALRREGQFIELRMVEAAGKSGEAFVKLNLPYQEVSLTNMLGNDAQALQSDKREVHIPIKPQQIVTLRFKNIKKIDKIDPLTDWTPLVPPSKRKALQAYKPDVKGHPPKGY